MAEPTSALSFSDLILRVAELAGMAYYGADGQGRALIPIDSYNLDRCKRIVNDGIRMFISNCPSSGWRWMRRIMSITFPVWLSGKTDSGSETTLVDADLKDFADDYFNGWYLYIYEGTGKGESATITDFEKASGTLTFSALSGGSTPDSTTQYRLFEDVSDVINGDPSRILLPQFFSGSASGSVEYAKNTNTISPIRWSSEAYIRSRWAIGMVTGHPLFIAIRPYQPISPTLSSSRRYELIMDSYPVGSDTIEFPYIVHFDNMQIETGIATGGTAQTLVDSLRKEADDYFNGWALTIIEGTGLGQTATITDYSGGTFTFLKLSGSGTPDTTSVYKVEPAANIHPAGIQFDQAILGACLAQTCMQITEISQHWIETYNKMNLADAWAIDAQSAPKILKRRKNEVIERTWEDVTFNS